MNIDLDCIIPHKPPMRLIDSVIENNDEFIRCEVMISTENIFYDSSIDGIYSWIGIEFMAQAIAVFAGLLKQDKAQLQKPAVGLLLSVRKFVSHKSYFKVGQQLMIIAKKDYMQDDVGVFNCEIIHENELIAQARLNTYDPPKDKLEKILKGSRL